MGEIFKQPGMSVAFDIKKQSAEINGNRFSIRLNEKGVYFREGDRVLGRHYMTNNAVVLGTVDFVGEFLMGGRGVRVRVEEPVEHKDETIVFMFDEIRSGYGGIFCLPLVKEESS